MPTVYLSNEAQQYARVLRLIRGYTKSVTSLAKELNMDRSSLSRKLNGEVPLTLMDFLKIKEVLKIEEEI